MWLLPQQQFLFIRELEYSEQISAESSTTVINNEHNLWEIK